MTEQIPYPEEVRARATAQLVLKFHCPECGEPLTQAKGRRMYSECDGWYCFNPCAECGLKVPNGAYGVDDAVEQ